MNPIRSSRNALRLLSAVLVLGLLVSRASAANFTDTFSTGANAWIAPPGWTLVEQADQNVVFRGDSIPDLFATRTDVILGRSWRLEVDLHFRNLYADGQRGLAGLALFPAPNSGVQLEINVGNLGRRNVQVDSQWFHTGTAAWNSVSGTDWLPHNSSVYRLHVFRPLNSDRLVVKLTSTNGFQYLTETAPIPVDVLNRMTVVGLRVNAGRVEFDNLRVTTPYNAPAAPVLTGQPQSLTLARGNPAEFRVRATGPGPLTYQWWRDTALLRNQTNDVLTLPSVLPVSAGAYRVVVTAGERTVTSDAAILTVIDGSLRLRPAGPSTPDLLALDVRVPAQQPYVLERSPNLRDWTEWSRGTGTGSSFAVEVPVGDASVREAYRLLFP